MRCKYKIGWCWVEYSEEGSVCIRCSALTVQRGSDKGRGRD